MPREAFDRDLQSLKERVIALGNIVEAGLVNAVTVFIENDKNKAQTLIDADAQVNQKRVEIVMECLTLIATQAPTASDMRSLATNIEVTGELERIHDYVKGIGKMTLLRPDESLPENIEDMLTSMAATSQSMFQDALRAFNDIDVEAAKSIPYRDFEVDRLFQEGSHELAISVTDDESTYQKFHSIQQVLNFMERAADRVTNICEWIIYWGIGEYTEIN